MGNTWMTEWCSRFKPFYSIFQGTTSTLKLASMVEGPTPTPITSVPYSLEVHETAFSTFGTTCGTTKHLQMSRSMSCIGRVAGTRLYGPATNRLPVNGKWDPSSFQAVQQTSRCVSLSSS